jgi:GT2 family glycosyltransferase
VENALVTVVDNGSADGSAMAIAAKYPNVKLFALSENLGFTGGLQAALRGSSARLVVFLNNDAVPQKGWLKALVQAIDQSPADVVSVGGKIVDLSGKLIDFIGGIMTFDGHAFQPGFRYPIGSRPEPADGEEILFACGGNMISRRAELMELGGFDNDYFAYLEDVDFGWRSWIAGHRVVYAAQAVVRHASSATSDKLGNVERGVLFERNALQTVLKNYEETNLREAAGAVFFSYLHRLHHYATTRNRRASELRRAPFEGTQRNASRSRFIDRVRRRIAGAPLLAGIDDPLTTMQFRAFEWIVQNSEKVAKKRTAVQSSRRRSDRDIFEKFPLHFVPTYPGDDSLMSSALFRLLRPRLPSVDRKLGDIIRT